MFKFNILPATSSQIPDIQAIISETWEPAYHHILSPEQISFMQEEIYRTASLENQMAAGQQFFIMYLNQNPVGFASYSSHQPEVYKLNKLYVKPDYQGQGFGSLLIRHIEKEVLKQGGNTLLLNVNRYNPAREKYEKLGFAVVAEEDIPIGPYWMNDYIMQKQILPSA
jgi:diamine N-acetyltransferase